MSGQALTRPNLRLLLLAALALGLIGLAGLTRRNDVAVDSTATRRPTV